MCRTTFHVCCYGSPHQGDPISQSQAHIPLKPLPPLGEGKIGLRGGGGGGGRGSPPKEGGGSGNGAPVTEPLVKYQSPRREVVRSSAGVGVAYPPFLGSFT